MQVSQSLPAAVKTLLLRAAHYISVSLDLQRERLLKARGDPKLIQQEIEERAQELARLRWVEEGYARERADTDAT